MYKLTPPFPPTNVKVTHKICHELLIGINISLYSLPGIWHYRPFTTLWSVCYSMLYERPGANVDTYKQTDRAVTSHTPILDPPNGHRGNLTSSLFISPPPLQSQTINISPFFAKKIITIQENSYLHFWNLIILLYISSIWISAAKFVSWIFKILSLYWISPNLVYETIYSSTVSFSIFPFKRAYR